MNEPYCQSYWDWVNMARIDGWRVISLAVHEDDLEGVPVVAGPLGAFYEKLSQLMNYCMAQPRNTVSGSTSVSFLIFPHISCSQANNNIVESMRDMSPSDRPLNLFRLLCFYL